MKQCRSADAVDSARQHTSSSTTLRVISNRDIHTALLKNYRNSLHVTRSSQSAFFRRSQYAGSPLLHQCLSHRPSFCLSARHVIGLCSTKAGYQNSNLAAGKPIPSGRPGIKVTSCRTQFSTPYFGKDAPSGKTRFAKYIFDHSTSS